VCSSRSLDKCYKKMLRAEKALKNCSFAPQTASFAAFENVFKDPAFREQVPNIDLRMIFTFLDEATGKHADGFIGIGEWLLLRGFDASALCGSPARLQKILEERHGSLAEAFHRMHANWLAGTLRRGLKQAAFEGLARSLCRDRGAAERGKSAQAGGGGDGHACALRPSSRAASFGELRPKFPAVGKPLGSPGGLGGKLTFGTNASSLGSSRAAGTSGGFQRASLSRVASLPAL